MKLKLMDIIQLEYHVHYRIYLFIITAYIVGWLFWSSLKSQSLAYKKVCASFWYSFFNLKLVYLIRDPFSSYIILATKLLL